MRARFIHQIGISGKLRIYWDKVNVTKIYEDGYYSRTYLNDCICSYGHPGSAGIHNAYEFLGHKMDTEDWNCFGLATDYPAERWPKRCAHCGTSVPEKQKPEKVGDVIFDVTHQVFTSRLYDTNSGEPEPGDIYYIKWHKPGECPNWNDCDGRHLHAKLPNGHDWDVDGRASNCTMKDDRSHRCWVRTGSPEDGTIHVDKNGHTCAAGAGSIIAGDWHGFLHHGAFHT